MLTGITFSPGESREAAKASSTCRTESRSTARSASTSPTGRTPGFRSSQLRAPFSRSGAGSTGPADIYIDPEDTIYICEMGFDSVPEVPHLRLMRDPPPGHDPFARVTICDPDGEIVARVGGGKDPTEPGNFMVPHGIWVDSRGALYVGEVLFVTELFGRFAPGKPRSLQKLVRSG